MLARVLFAESTTLGVRTADWDRLVLPRESHRIETPFGRISVKFARRPGGQLDVSAEVDDCRRAAVRTGTPLREVVRVVEETARARLAEGEPVRATGASLVRVDNAATSAHALRTRDPREGHAADGARSARGWEVRAMAEIPNAVIKRLLTKHGDGLRVSASALDKAVAATEDYVARLAREAHASRPPTSARRSWTPTSTGPRQDRLTLRRAGGGAAVRRASKGRAPERVRSGASCSRGSAASAAGAYIMPGMPPPPPPAAGLLPSSASRPPCTRW